jgi:FlaG/FlaF family flagellin (archaellin)
MPKKKSSRPAASLGSNQNEEPKSASQIRRERVIRMGAIVIVLALLLSLLAGAFSITPAQAASTSTTGNAAKFVQNIAKSLIIGAADPITPIDTDGDGIANNEDSDIDNDGLVNANDGDIDGDGTANFEDGDPAETNGFDGNLPAKPGSLTFNELTENGSFYWLIGAGILALAVIGVIVRKTLQTRAKRAQKNL